MKRTYSVDMIHGSILNKLFIYALPLILSGLLQLFFNAADIIVVGKYSGATALAAVGSTGALINLLINLFVGLSIGTNVLVARFIGANQHDDVEETVHTSLKVALIGGVLMIFVGFFFSKPLLELMGTPNDVIDQSVLYMRIYFLCMPAFMVYNFGSAVLRAVGDTRRPLYYLAISGVINVVLNLIFVVNFNMGVAGVALATAISQVISALFITNSLMRSDGPIRLTKHKLTISKDKLFQMMKIGLPAGFQGIVFSLSNVLIQSSVNSFGSTVMAGNTAAGNIEGFVYIAMNAIYQTSLSFTSQNFGAKNFNRIKKVTLYCMVIVSGVGLLLGVLAYVFGETLLSLYTSDLQVIEYGMIRLSIISVLYFICGIMDVLCGVIRGLGNSVAPMIISLLGVCGIRVLWLVTVFQKFNSLETIYVSYPITWTIAVIAQGIFLLFAFKKVRKEIGN